MKFKLLNANLWLLPFTVSRENRKRLKRFISLVNKLDPDIIALQEVWMKLHIRYLKKRLPNYNFYYKKSKIYNKSGLLTLSKIKLNFKHTTFDSKGLHIIEKIAQKGYQVLTTGKLQIINTHLYNDFFSISDVKTIKQFQQLKKQNTILSGDLNLPLERFKQLNKGFYKVSNTEITCTKKNKYQTVSYNKLSTTNSKIDYIASSYKGAKINTKLIKKPLVSDHYILFSKISIN